MTLDNEWKCGIRVLDSLFTFYRSPACECSICAVSIFGEGKRNAPKIIKKPNSQRGRKQFASIIERKKLLRCGAVRNFRLAGDTTTESFTTTTPAFTSYLMSLLLSHCVLPFHRRPGTNIIHLLFLRCLLPLLIFIQ